MLFQHRLLFVTIKDFTQYSLENEQSTLRQQELFRGSVPSLEVYSGSVLEIELCGALLFSWCVSGFGEWRTSGGFPIENSTMLV